MQLGARRTESVPLPSGLPHRHRGSYSYNTTLCHMQLQLQLMLHILQLCICNLNSQECRSLKSVPCGRDTRNLADCNTRIHSK